MIPISSPNELPVGTLHMYLVKDEQEARQIGLGYLYQSKIIKGLYLFVEAHDVYESV